jgi:Zn-dependent protease with chaperone function
MLVTVPLLSFGVGMLSQSKLLTMAAVATGTSGLLILGLVALAGYLSRSNRTLLLTFFRPGLSAVVPVLLILISLHALLAISAIYLIETGGPGGSHRLHWGVLLAIGGGALAGVVALANVSSQFVKRATVSVVGRRRDENQDPAIWSFVRKLAATLGTDPLQHLVVGLEPMFFVTEADVSCLDGELAGRTLYFSLPLCRILNQSELTAVLSHELGHFRGLDTRFSQEFYPIYRGTERSLAAVADTMGKGVRRVALYPAFAILSSFLHAFTVAERGISRERELAADQVAAQSTAPQTVAVALIKVAAFAGHWNTVVESMRNALAEGKQFVNVSLTFSRFVQQHSRPEALQGLDERQIAHPTDSHPPISHRLRALGVSLLDISGLALATSPDSHASALITDTETVERDLTIIAHAILARTDEATSEEQPMEF